MTNINESSEDEGRPMRRLTLRTRIMRCVVAPFFAALAVLSVVLGIANATFWKPNDVVISYAHVTGTRYIVTDPGVLNLVDNRVRISVAALHTRKPICVAVGLTKDVRGWVSGFPVQRITGLSDWHNLSVSKIYAKSTVNAASNSNSGDPDIPFQKSNLWPVVTCQLGLAKLSINTEDYVQTAGSASYDHAVESGAVSKSGNRVKNNPNHRNNHSMRMRSQTARRVLLIDLGSNMPDASVELRWRRRQIPDFATPMYFMALLFAVLALLAATIFAMAPHRRRNKRIVANRSGVLSVKPARNDEVSFVEAFAGSWSNLFSRNKHKKSSGSHARHGSHARRNKPMEQNVNGVYDSQKLRSASASTAVSITDSLAETTVISQDELLAFAARFMQQQDSDSDSGLKDNSAFDKSQNSGEDLQYSANSDAGYSNANISNSADESADSSNASSKKQNSVNSQNAQNKKNTQNKQTNQSARSGQNGKNNRDNRDNRDNRNSHDSQNRQNNQNPQSKQTKQNKHGAKDKQKSKDFRRENGDFYRQQKRNKKRMQSKDYGNNDAVYEANNQKLDASEGGAKTSSGRKNATNSEASNQYPNHRGNRRGYHGSVNNKYRKNNRGYKGNASNERGNEQ